MSDQAKDQSTVTLQINHQEITVPKGTTVLEAARELGIHIPTLCHLDLHDFKMVNSEASCRVCMVEEEGWDKMIPACSTPCKEGMNLRTDTIKVIRTRRMMIELLLSDHPKDCLICPKMVSANCKNWQLRLGCVRSVTQAKVKTCPSIAHRAPLCAT